MALARLTAFPFDPRGEPSKQLLARIVFGVNATVDIPMNRALAATQCLFFTTMAPSSGLGGTQTAAVHRREEQ